MKKFLLSTLFFGLVANAQEVTISHSNSMDLGNTMVACGFGNPQTSRDNIYYRFFNLSDFGITEDFAISKITFGYSAVNHPTLDAFPIFVKLYSTSSSTFPGTYPDGFTELSNVDHLVEDISEGEIEDFNYTTPVVIPAGMKLVVALGFEEQIEGSANRLFFAGNNAGQTGPTYILSGACNILAPTDLNSVGNGFPNAQLVLSVTGTPNLSAETFLDSKFTIYPNPVTDVLHIKANEIFDDLIFELNDINGRTLYNGTSDIIDMANFNAGVYLLNIIQNGQSIGNKKVVKK